METDGTNLATVLADPDVDCTRTVSNDIVEICSVRLAASHVVSSASPCGCRAHGRDAPGCGAPREPPDARRRRYVNTGHGHRRDAAGPAADAAGGHFVRRRLRQLSAFSCLCDTMCFRGSLMAISRHGINRGDSGRSCRHPSKRPSKSSSRARSSREKTTSTASRRISCSGSSHVGTGVSDLLLDSAQLEHAVEFDPGPAAERFPAGVGRRVSRRSGSRPGAGDDALRVVSGRFIRGFSRARRRDAGLGRRGLFSTVVAYLPSYRRCTARRRFTGVAGVRRRGVAGVRRWGSSPAYSCVPASAILVTFIVRTC